MINDDPPLEKPSDPTKLTLESLPSELKYVFLRNDKSWPVVIPSSLSEKEEQKILDVLRKKREVMGWTIFDLEKISPITCTNYSGRHLHT